MARKSSKRPVDIYKQIIDELVKDTPSMAAGQVVKDGIYSKAPDFQPLNALVQRLTRAERKLLAQSYRTNDQVRFMTS